MTREPATVNSARVKSWVADFNLAFGFSAPTTVRVRIPFSVNTRIRTSLSATLSARIIRPLNISVFFILVWE